MGSRVKEVLFVLTVFFLVSCNKKDEKKPQYAPLVAVAKVERRDVPLVIESQAKVTGSLEVNVYAQVGGIIKSRLFSEGSYVKKGTQLFQIDPSMYKAAMNQAAGALTQARSEHFRAKQNYARVNRLFRADAVSRRVYDEALSAMNAAEGSVKIAHAALDIAKINYGYTKVYAPISGIVRKELQTVGNLISTGQGGLLTSMVQISPLHVEFSVPGTTWRSVMEKQLKGYVLVPKQSEYKVELLMSDGSIYPKIGKLIFSDISEDLVTGSISMKAEVSNGKDDKLLMPGQFVRVRLLGIKYPHVLVMPVKALIHTTDGFAVYKVNEENLVSIVKVKIIDYCGDEVLIESGLAEGDVVVSDGIIKVRPGIHITRSKAPIYKTVQKGEG